MPIPLHSSCWCIFKIIQDGLFLEFLCFIIDFLQMSGNCDQVCTNSNGSFSCSCVPGYRLSTADNHSCTAVNVPETEQPSIIFANSVDIQHIRIDGRPVSSQSKIATHETLALDYLHRNRTVCWISHAHLATTRQKRDLTGTFQIYFFVSAILFLYLNL